MGRLSGEDDSLVQHLLDGILFLYAPRLLDLAHIHRASSDIF